MQISQILFEIDGEIARLQQARNILSGAGGASNGRRTVPDGSTAAKTAKKRAGKRKLSAEGRRKISEAMKARWAERRKRIARKASR